MKRVLVAVDDSVTADLLLERAIEVARATSAKLRILHVVSAPIIVRGVSSPPRIESLFTSAETWTRSLLERVPLELRDGAVVELGTPAEKICTNATSYAADLVVIGAHRYGVLSRVLGTTAGAIVNRMDRPVLVVRAMPEVAIGALGDRELVQRERSFALPGALLREEHARLERLYEALLAAYGDGDWSDVGRQWTAFEAKLLAHMETEESRVFPYFREVDPGEVDGLLSEHGRIRRLLGELGVLVDLHAVPADDAAELIRRLREHATREDHLLYRWLDDTQGGDPRDLLGRRTEGVDAGETSVAGRA